MLEFLGKELKTEFDYDFLKDNISDFHYMDLDDGDESYVYLKPVQFLNESFAIDLSFKNKLLTDFILHSSRFEHKEAASLHRKWLDENFGQHKTWVGHERHYITDEYDFYEYYDPRSTSAEIWCKVLK